MAGFTSSADIMKCRTRNGDGKAVISRQFRKGGLLWEGASASYHEATCLDTAQVFTVKIVPKTTSGVPAKLRREIDLHRALQHPNILGYEMHFWDAHNVYILLEPCSSTESLADFVQTKSISEDEAKAYTNQILDAICYLHEHRIVHSDLRLQNMFIGEDDNLKLCDFGLATKLVQNEEEVSGETERDSIHYAAPEIVRRGGTTYDHKADLWSLGVMLYVILTGRLPFQGADKKAESTRRRILANRYWFPVLITLSDSAEDLIRRLLDTDPQRRLSLEGVRSHPFFCPPLSEPASPPSPAPAPAPAPELELLQRQLDEALRAKTEAEGLLKKTRAELRRRAVPASARGALGGNGRLPCWLPSRLIKAEKEYRQASDAHGQNAHELKKLRAQLPQAQRAVEDEMAREGELARRMRDKLERVERFGRIRRHVMAKKACVLSGLSSADFDDLTYLANSGLDIEFLIKSDIEKALDDAGRARIAEQARLAKLGANIQVAEEKVAEAKGRLERSEMALMEERNRPHRETRVSREHTLRDLLNQERTEKESLERRLAEVEAETAKELDEAKAKMANAKATATATATATAQLESGLEELGFSSDEEEEEEEELETLRGEAIETGFVERPSEVLGPQGEAVNGCPVGIGDFGHSPATPPKGAGPRGSRSCCCRCCSCCDDDLLPVSLPACQKLLARESRETQV